jgi:hypothetical protein
VYGTNTVRIDRESNDNNPHPQNKKRRTKEIAQWRPAAHQIQEKPFENRKIKGKKL